MITENITRDVAEAQVSDDCRVELWVAELRKNRIATLTPTQAHILAAELVAAAERADDAAEELRHIHEPAAFDVQHISPDCRDGYKHAACIGRAWDAAADGETDCTCECHGSAT